MSSLDVKQIITWIFYAVLSGAATLVTSNLTKISSSVQELNQHMAVVLYQQGQHEKRLDKQEKRLEDILRNLERE